MRANEVRAWFRKRGAIGVVVVLAGLAVGVASLLPATAGKAPRGETGTKDKKVKEDECSCPGNVIAVPGVRTFAVALGEEGAYLGLLLGDDEAEESEDGARITQVIPDTPADEAGLEAGDVIVRFEGEAIGGPLALTKQIRSREAGDRVSITVLRDGREKVVEVELGQRSKLAGAPYAMPFGDNADWSEWRANLEEWKEDLAEEGAGSVEHWRDFARQFTMPHGKPKLGVQLVATTPELRRHLGGKEDAGVLVGKVLADTPAERGGIRVGDLIVAVAGAPVEDAEGLIEELDDKDGETFPIQVVREGKTLTIEIAIPEPEDEEEADGPRAMIAPRAPRFRIDPPAPPPVAAIPEPPESPDAPAPPAPPAFPVTPFARGSV